MTWVIGDSTAEEARALIGAGCNVYLVEPLINRPAVELLDVVLGRSTPLDGKLQPDTCSWQGRTRVGIYVDLELLEVLQGCFWAELSAKQAQALNAAISRGF